MKDDIRQPDLGQFIQVNQHEHTTGTHCPGCRSYDKHAASLRRTERIIRVETARLDTLAAHCKHPQTKTILMQRFVENEQGVALEQPEDVEQCLGCARVLWERVS